MVVQLYKSYGWCDKMACVIFETAWGYVGVAATWVGISRIILPMVSASNVEPLLKGAPEDESCEAEQLSTEASQALVSYFNGLYDERLQQLPVDLRDVSDVHKRILLEARRVPIGQTMTYGELAALAGLRNGARVVGHAMACNPVPILIPCHRVIRADGRIGGFSYGVEIKWKLLMHERNMLRCE